MHPVQFGKTHIFLTMSYLTLCIHSRQSILSETTLEQEQQLPQQQEEEPNIIIIRRETADLIRQNNIPPSFLDDVD